MTHTTEKAALPYEAWSATRDTLHAHTQVLGKLAAALAPGEPQLQHAALRLSARGWETLPLPAPNGTGAFVVALDLHAHEALVEHSDGRTHRLPLAPDRSVREVTREVLAAVAEIGGHVELDLTPRETPWTTPLDEDDEHATYDPKQVAAYFAAATRAALVLASVRAPYRGRSTPVNAWWGSFDLAVNLLSGRPAEPPSTDFIMRNEPRSMPTLTPRRPGSTRRRSYPRPLTGMRRSASTSSTGMTWLSALTRTRPHSSSPARRPNTPATSASGIPPSLPASRRRRPPSRRPRGGSSGLELSLADVVPLELEPRKPMRLPAFVPKPISLSPYPGGVQAVEKAALDGPDGCLLARHAPILPYCSPQAKW